MTAQDMKAELQRLDENVQGLQSRFTTLLNAHNELERMCKQENVNRRNTEQSIQDAAKSVYDDLEKYKRMTADPLNMVGLVVQKVAAIETRIAQLEAKPNGHSGSRPRENLSAKREVKSLTKYGGKPENDFHEWRNSLRNVFEQVCEDVLLIMDWADSQEAMDDVTERTFKKWVHSERHDLEDMRWAAQQLYHILFRYD